MISEQKRRRLALKSKAREKSERAVRLMDKVIQDTAKYDEERISSISQIVRDLYQRFGAVNRFVMLTPTVDAYMFTE